MDPWGNSERYSKKQPRGGDRFAALSANVRTIAENARKLDDMMNDIGTRRDTRDLRNRIRDLRNETAELVQEAKAIIAEGSQPSEKSKLDKLANEFQTALKTYERAAQESIRKEKELLTAMELHMSQGGDNRQSVGKYDLQEIGLGDVDEAIIEEQNREIRELERDLVGLADVFKDVKELIEEQGTALDPAEQNVRDAEETTRGAVVELKKANKLACAARWKILIIVVLCLVILLLIVLVIALAVGITQGNK